MFSKYRLQKLGFDFVDQDREYFILLNSVCPSGPSNFREMYATGIGILLNFNQNYLSHIFD